MKGQTCIHAFATVLMIVALSVAQETQACRCIEPSLEQAYERADMVVDAVIIKVLPGIYSQESTGLLRVSSAWKAVSPEEIAVLTSTTCAYPWQVNERHVLFLVKEPDGTYSTGRCMGNKSGENVRHAIEWLEVNAAPCELE